MEENTIALVLAGGEGKRLRPLTKPRAKPAVPFAGKYRILDVKMSGIYYAKIPRTVVLLQHELRSLNRHVQEAWTVKGGTERSIITAPPRTGGSKDWYKGTADAIVHNLDEVYEYGPDHVAVFAADHITNLNVTDFLRSHHESPRDLTIAGQVRRLSKEDFNGEKYKYGVLIADIQTHEVIRFLEKPTLGELEKELGIGLGDQVLISMGDYIFQADSLVGALGRNYGVDFGNHVIPGMKKDGAKIYVYPFSGYWRDVGGLVDYYNTSLELLLDNPPLDLHQLLHDGKPILTLGTGMPPTRFGNSGKRSLISEGCDIGKDVVLENCIISPGVQIGASSVIRESIIFNDAVIQPGSEIQYTIIDKYNRNLPSRIGYDLKEDRAKDYTVVQYGNQRITVVPRAIPLRKRWVA